MEKQNIKRVEIQKGDLFAVGVQNLDLQPGTHTVYQLTLYRAGRKIHNEEMKVYSRQPFVIDKQEIQEAAEFVSRVEVGV